MDNLLKLIKDRRNIRDFKTDPISEELLLEILEAGRWAPSVHNTQPWHFVIVKNEATKKRLIGIINQEAKKLHAGFNLVLKDALKTIETAPVLLFAYKKGILSRKFAKLGRNYKIRMEEFEM